MPKGIAGLLAEIRSRAFLASTSSSPSGLWQEQDSGGLELLKSALLLGAQFRIGHRHPRCWGGLVSDATALGSEMRSRVAARWRLPSVTAVRNETYLLQMPKADADRASAQSLLSITRPRAGVLPWM